MNILESYVRNLFPSMTYLRKDKEISSKKFKRAVFFYFNSQKNQFEIRNYFIKQTFTNINKNIKKILNSNKIPDFSNYKDVGEVFG